MVAGLVPKIESAMMYSNNVVVFMDLCIMGVMFVISLSPNLFLDRPSPQLLPLSCTVGMLLLLTVAAVSLPSPSQAINHNKCSRIVCIDILTWYSEFNKLAVCSVFTFYFIMCFVLPLRTELTAHISFCSFAIGWGNRSINSLRARLIRICLIKCVCAPSIQKQWL